MFTAKKLYGYHLENKPDVSGEISSMLAKAESAKKSAQANGGELNDEFELSRTAKWYARRASSPRRKLTSPSAA